MSDFTIYNLKKRLDLFGDIFLPVNTDLQDITPLVEKLTKV